MNMRLRKSLGHGYSLRLDRDEDGYACNLRYRQNYAGYATFTYTDGAGYGPSDKEVESVDYHAFHTFDSMSGDALAAFEFLVSDVDQHAHLLSHGALFLERCQINPRHRGRKLCIRMTKRIIEAVLGYVAGGTYVVMQPCPIPSEDEELTSEARTEGSEKLMAYYQENLPGFERVGAFLIGYAWLNDSGRMVLEKPDMTYHQDYAACYKRARLQAGKTMVENYVV